MVGQRFLLGLGLEASLCAPPGFSTCIKGLQAGAVDSQHLGLSSIRNAFLQGSARTRLPLWPTTSRTKQALSQRSCHRNRRSLDTARIRVVADGESLSNVTVAPQRGSAEAQYILHVEGGGQVKAWVSREWDVCHVSVEVKTDGMRLDLDRPLLLRWGLSRSDRSEWVWTDQQPPNTYPANDETRGMLTPMNRSGWATQCLTFDIQAHKAPLFVNFDLYQTPSKDGEQPRIFKGQGGSSFCVPVGMRKGAPGPLGVTWGKNGSVNFSLYSRNAEGVVLCLYDNDTSPVPAMEIDLIPSMHRTGDTWHVELESLGNFRRYGYRCRGEVSWDAGNRFHARAILLDPYARLLARPVPGQEDLPSPAAVLGLLAPEPSFDWEGDYPPGIPLEGLVVYNLNVTMFTVQESSQVAPSARGTFLGVAQKADYLVSLGVNAVLVQPVAAFDAKQGVHFPVSFFAPDPSYGPEGDSASASWAFKTMVKELHRNGIEVLMDVVVSHTAEKSDLEPQMISFRGIDASTYYVIDEFGKQVALEPGTMNTLNCNHPTVQRLVVDSFRHWVENYHVDGFRIVGAAGLTTGPQGRPLTRPPLVEALTFDPVLAGAKLIADGCSPISGVCQPLNFPHWGRWTELNRCFRDDVRRFMRGEQGQLSGLATRFFGSGDLFAAGRGPNFGLNYVATPSGYTLADVVSFSHSTDSELSWNCGEEGPSSNPAVNQLRFRQVRNFYVILLMSQGVPVLSMGDEYGHSKQGERGPLERSGAFNWATVQDQFARDNSTLISTLVAFRRRRRSLFQRRTFLKSTALTWHGREANRPEWEYGESCFIAAMLHSDEAADAEEGAAPAVEDPNVGDVYVAFNAQHYAVRISIPPAAGGMLWYRIADTSLGGVDDFATGVAIRNAEDPFSPYATYDLEAYSTLLLEARADPEMRSSSSSGGPPQYYA